MVCLLICPSQRDNIREYLGDCSARPFGTVNTMFEMDVVLFNEFSIFLMFVRLHGRTEVAKAEGAGEYYREREDLGW
jgi:hypothetical protein